MEQRDYRIRTENDAPATEKQLAYAQNLLQQMREWSIERGQDGKYGDDFEWPFEPFWRLAELPADLTKGEASQLIDELRQVSPGQGLNHGILVAKRILKGEKPGYTRDENGAALLPLTASFEYLVQYVQSGGGPSKLH